MLDEEECRHRLSLLSPLTDHYQAGWSGLWWVRVHADGSESPVTDEIVDAPARRYRQYSTAGAIAGALVLTPTEVTGWSAG